MPPSSIALILPLAHADKSRKTGAKATHLAAIVAARFAVPRGFVISADAYRYHLWAAGTRAMASAQPDAEQREQIRSAILAQPIREDVWQCIADAYERLSWQTGTDQPRVAVRSSAIEDGAAHPGAYESCLNVSGLEALAEAIKRVWASLWSGKAAAYRARLQATGEPAMAVIVQQMVQSGVFGTASTANPVTGDPTRVMVTARSNGRSAHYTVNLRDLSVDKTPDSDEHCADEELVRLVADRSILIERAMGGRVAVEWAVDRDGLWILQADPIPDLPDYFPVDWQDDRDGRVAWLKQSPRALSEFAQSLVEAYPTKVGAVQRVINGYLYASEIESHVLGVGEVGRCAALLDKFEKHIRIPLRQRLVGMLDTDWTAVDWRTCTQSLKSAAGAQREFYAWMRLGDSMRARTSGLLCDILHGSSLASRLLGGVQTAEFQRDALLEDLAQRFATAERAGWLEKADWRSQYRCEVDRFARDYGGVFVDAGQGADPADWRSWVEDAETVFRAIDDASKSDTERTLVTLQCAAEHEAAAAEAELVGSLRGKSRTQVELVLALARGWVRVASQATVDCAFATAAVRLIALQLGRRLEAAGVLSSFEDVFCLRLHEILRLQPDIDAAGRSELAALISRRKHEAWLCSRFAAPERITPNF